MIGETIGNYKVVSLLGAGGMGEVYLAEHLSIGTTVAIKILQTHISKDAEHVQRFFNEARAVSKVRHAGTVKIFDVGFHQGHAYLVMEFLDGESLAARIRRLGNLPGDQVADIGKQIAGVLDAVHTAGVTHRDLKPDNIYLVPDSELASGERVKVLDFGIAKLTGTLGGNSPQTKGTMGTPAYMAPEQWNNAANVDGRADTYSLGCVIFEMACGKPPFPASSVGEACTHHLHSKPPRASELVPQVPPQFDALIDRMLAKTVDLRPTIKEVARAFDELRASGASGRWTNTPHPGLAATLPPTITPRSTPVPIQPTPVPQPMPAHAPTQPSGPYLGPIATPTPQTATPHPTTMPKGEVGRPPSSKKGLVFAVVGVVLVGGIATLVVVASKSSSGSGSSGTTNPLVAHDAAEQVASHDAAAIDAPPSLRDRVVEVNPFVELGGVKLLAHQVTNKELAWDTAHAIPGRTNTGPDAPAAWLTSVEAEAFCAAIGARLPTSEDWERAARGSWGITVLDARGAVTGPLQEWTSTIKDELVVVRGAHAGMTDAARARASKQNPPFFLQKELAAPGSDRNTTASATIGFRCVDKGGSLGSRDAGKPDDFVDVAAAIPDVVLDIRYATKHNFTGDVLYPSATCKLRRAVTTRLVQVADALRKQERRLLLWDCYRPTSIQKLLWKKVPDERYVANPATGSNHGRGAAIDLALVDAAGKPVRLPTDFDDFTDAAHRDHALVGDAGAEARRLGDAMTAAGFTPIPHEWWHFDAPDSASYGLSDEPLAVAQARARRPTDTIPMKTLGSPGQFDALVNEPLVKPSEKAVLRPAELKAGLASIASKVQSCYAGTPGNAKLKLAIAASGKVTSATVLDGPFAGKPVGACIARQVMTATFPASQLPINVSYTYSLGP